MFFPLKFRATIERKTATQDSWGQEIGTWTVIEPSAKCLFLATSGNKGMQAREQFGTTIAFYCEPTTQLEEGDRITNILDVNGDVIEPGPFEAQSVKRVGNHLTGKQHHISAKLIGAA